ncbi:hypothetical protein M9H77_31753 [Catharanthus roseus]|uniref:Uncharacterized protein n=1 Tax=Catharanthus roseus TaxID=4058 RepID=A0ACC0A1C2_CATRO|nr:hypothetical protein M9H77_31753 [Catharanthus roseus]
MARRLEKEHRGKIARFKKMIQDLAWQVIGDQEEDFKRSKTILWSSVQVEESKEANLGRLEASKTKRGSISAPYHRRVEENDFNVANCDSFVLRVEDIRSMEKELGPTLADISISLSLNLSSLCYEVSIEELKSLLDSYNFQFLRIDHMLKFSSSCAFLEKQLTVSIARIKPSCRDLELLHDNLIFDRLFANVSTSCASMCSKICIFLRAFVENGYDERAHCFFWTLCGDFHAKFKGEIVENFDYESSFLYASKKNLDGFIPFIKLLSFNFLFKDETLNESIVQNTKSCVKLENQSLGATLHYSLTFKEFFDDLIFQGELKVLQFFMLNQECSLLNNVLKLFWKNSHKNFLFYHLPFKEIFWKHELAKEQVNTSKYFYGSYWWTRSKRERIWCYHLQFEELSWKFGVANEVQNDAKPFNTNSLTSKRNFLANDICDLEVFWLKLLGFSNIFLANNICRESIKELCKLLRI